MNKKSLAENKLSSVGELIISSTKRLSQTSSSPRLDSLLLISIATNKSKSWILANQDFQLNIAVLENLDILLKRRQNYEPISYIRNSAEFYNLDLYVNQHVLSPRAETENLVTLASKLAKNNTSVIDVGTGSGAIAIALRSIRPDLKITATDISNDALEVAEKNINKYAFHDIKLIRTNIIDDILDKSDVVIANLPYLVDSKHKSPTIKHEPDLALYSGNDGLAHYKKLISALDTKKLINKNGYLLIEALSEQHKQLEVLASSHGFSLERITGLAMVFVFKDDN